jgi:hypothetical protein
MACTRCIIPDSYPKVTFENGLCTFCRRHEVAPHVRRDFLGEEKLRELLMSKNTGSHHCIVPLSGGKDSSYILLHVARKMGLRPLAVHFDSGFIEEQTKSNIEKLCSALSVELVTVRSSLHRKKMLQQSMKMARYGKFAGVSGLGGTCVSCENSTRTAAISEARKRNIPFLLWGSTDFEDSPDAFLSTSQQTFRDTYGEHSRRFNFTRIARFYDSVVGDYRVLKYFWHLPFMALCASHVTHKLKYNAEMGITKGLSRLDPFFEVSFNGTGLEVVYFFQYIPYDPFRHIEELNREVGWETLVGKQVRQDCMLHHLLNYRTWTQTGLSHDGFFLAVLVREGLLTREQALEKEKSVTEHLKENAERVLKALDIDVPLEKLV